MTYTTVHDQPRTSGDTLIARFGPDARLVVDGSCCIVLEVTGDAGAVLRRVTVTDAGTWTGALRDACTQVHLFEAGEPAIDWPAARR